MGHSRLSEFIVLGQKRPSYVKNQSDGQLRYEFGRSLDLRAICEGFSFPMPAVFPGPAFAFNA